MKDRDFLLWIHARLIERHNENPNVDYMNKLKCIAESIDPDNETPNVHSCSNMCPPAKCLNNTNYACTRLYSGCARKAARIRIILKLLIGIRIRFDNMRKLFPNSQCYNSWKPSFSRVWSGKLWLLELRGYTLVLDWRGGTDGVFRDLSAQRCVVGI